MKTGRGGNAPPVDAPDFELSPGHTLLLGELSRAARTEFGGLVQQMDDDGAWPTDGFSRFARMGILGATVEERFGGAGLDLFSSGLIGQALGRVDPALSTTWQSHDNLCVDNLARNATPDQAERYLPKLCSGEWVGSLAMTEPGAGSDALGGMATRAIRDGDSYVLNGTKTFITNSPIADVALVYARTDPDRGKHGISAFIVERTMPGFSAAAALDKMGIRGSPTGELYFDDCRVPAANLLGNENEGLGIMMSGLDVERAIYTMMITGMSERALELSIAYAKDRKQFGRPIGEFQMVQAKIAEMYAAVESMRTFSYRVLARCSSADRAQAGRGELHSLSAAALLHAAESASRVVDEAVQIHGGLGFMRETEVNRLYRAAKIQEIGAGTKEIRRLIIARELLAE